MSGLLSMLAMDCVPTQQSAFSPIGREVESRTGFRIKWQHRAMQDPKTRAAIAGILSEPLHVDGAIKIALANNSELQASFEEVGISLGEVASASVLQNPELDAALRIPLNGDEPIIDLGLMQDVLSLFSLGKRREAAYADLNAARMRAAGAVIDLIAEVRMAVYRAQADLQLLRLLQTNRDAASASFELSQRQRDAGNITELALAQEHLLLNEANLSLATAELQVAMGREKLNVLLGLSAEDTSWHLVDELPGPTDRQLATTTLEVDAIGQSLDLHVARAGMESIAAAIGVARVEAWLPHLAVGASAERESSGEWAVGPVMSISVPLFDRQQGARLQGHAKLRQAQHRYTALAIAVRADARAASAALKAARARAVYLRDVLVPMREKVLEETLKMYNAMSTGPFQLLQAKREEIASRMDYIEALYEYWSARGKVQQILQGRMSNTMRAPVSASDDSAGMSSREH